MTLADITLGDCTVECHTVRDRFKEIVVFDAQVCEFRSGFLVTGQPKCTGRCDARTECKPSVSYSWAIVKQTPANSATIVGSSTGRTVKVRGTVLLGRYVLELTVTLQCKCGDKAVGAPLVRVKTKEFLVNQNCH
jgi:hypothetical protein